MKYRESSEMRGIKVKEKVNYYIFGDEGTASQITISFDKDTKLWTVSAGGKHSPSGILEWWKDGAFYNFGETIATFTDGEEISFTIMEQHKEVIPYVNYMYDVVSTPSGTDIYGKNDFSIRVAKDPDEIDSCIFYKYDGENLIKASKKMSATNVIEYKSRYQDIHPDNNLPIIFGSIKLDWFGMDPGPGIPQRSFRAIANNDYIYYNGENVPKDGIIKTWTPADYDEFIIEDRSDTHKVYKPAKAISSVHLTKRLGGSTLGNVVLDRESIYHDEYFTHKDVYYNGHYHKAMYLVYDNPTVDGCWSKRIESLCLTFAYPFWLLMASKDGIEYNGTTYLARKLIKSWRINAPVNLSLKETTYKKKPKSANASDGDFEMIIYGIQSVSDSAVVTLTKTVGGKLKDTKTFEPTNGSVKFGNIQFKLSGNTWTVYAKCPYIKYNDQSYKDDDPIFNFDIYEPLTTQVYDESNKYFYDKVVYDILSIGGSTTVNVARLLNDEEKESRSFTPEERSVTFGNIMFKLAGNSWTIYSKSAHIKYGGRTYLNNKPILSFDIAEQMHIQITDETDKYEIKEVTNYIIKTPSESDISYEVHTSETVRTMKIIKKNAGVEQPWITVNFYDALYKPYIVDDISLKFYNNNMSWELFSNNDDLYFGGDRYKKGETIAKWSYRDNVKFEDISVYHSVSNLVEFQVRKSTTGNIITNNEIDYDFGYFSDSSEQSEDEEEEENIDFNISYSCYNGTWKVTSKYDNIWCDGVNYTEGQVIRSFKTKELVPFFTVMATRYSQDEPEVPVDILYSFSVNIDPLNGSTTVTVSSYGHNDVSLTDKNVSKGIITDLTMSTDDAKSMYGYIWQREEEPIPPVGSLYIVVALYKESVGSAITSIYTNNVPLRIKVNHEFTNQEDPVSLTGYFNKLFIDSEYHVFWSVSLGNLPKYVVDGYGATVTRIYYYENNIQTSNTGYGVLLQNGDIVYCQTAGSISKGKYTIVYENEVCKIKITNITVISESGYGIAYFLKDYIYILSNGSFVAINFDDGFNPNSATGFKPGFRYSDGLFSEINGNQEDLDVINIELQGEGCTILANSFDKNTAIAIGSSSVVASHQIGKNIPSFTNIDMTYFGNVIMEYDFDTNSIEYHNKYETKQQYYKKYKFNNKNYLWTIGPTWYYIVQVSPLEIAVGGDLNVYMYEINTVEDYLGLYGPLSTIEREVDTSSIIPDIIWPSIDVNRIDSEDTVSIKISNTNVVDAFAINPGPAYADYTDKLIVHNNGIIAVLDNASFTQSGGNFAWSLDNYGIDNNYN